MRDDAPRDSVASRANATASRGDFPERRRIAAPTRRATISRLNSGSHTISTIFLRNSATRASSKSTAFLLAFLPDSPSCVNVSATFSLKSSSKTPTVYLFVYLKK